MAHSALSRLGTKGTSSLIMKSAKSNAELSGELKSLRDFFSYNAYVRQKYLELLSTLPEDTLTKYRGASFPSILDIFVHILDVYHCWFYAYEKGKSCNRWEYASKTGELIPPELKGLSIDQVKKMERQIDQLVQRNLKSLHPKDLTRSFSFSQGRGKQRETKSRNVAEMLWHLIEEELQHRGEMNALLWEDDVEPPVTSWFGWKKTLAR
jgi:uncharacterized damage-inducible protein DinB